MIYLEPVGGLLPPPGSAGKANQLFPQHLIRSRLRLALTVPVLRPRETPYCLQFLQHSPCANPFNLHLPPPQKKGKPPKKGKNKTERGLNVQTSACTRMDLCGTSCSVDT